jgi:hypothetical protein
MPVNPYNTPGTSSTFHPLMIITTKTFYGTAFALATKNEAQDIADFDSPLVKIFGSKIRKQSEMV